MQSLAGDRFMPAWRDDNDEGTQGGARSAGKGRYLLLRDQMVIIEGRMEWPNDGNNLPSCNIICVQMSGESTLSAVRLPVLRAKFPRNFRGLAGAD
jgi:hypothetical protein